MIATSSLLRGITSRVDDIVLPHFGDLTYGSIRPASSDSGQSVMFARADWDLKFEWLWLAELRGGSSAGFVRLGLDGGSDRLEWHDFILHGGLEGVTYFSNDIEEAVSSFKYAVERIPRIRQRCFELRLADAKKIGQLPPTLDEALAAFFTRRFVSPMAASEREELTSYARAHWSAL